jgi:hypothetical protein
MLNSSKNRITQVIVLGYLTIFVSSLCGYTGMPIWTVGAATVALASLSVSEHYRVYRRAAELGHFRQVDQTLLGSTLNALCGTSAAYVCGLVVRYLAGV